MSVSTTPRSSVSPDSACWRAPPALEGEGLGDHGHGENAHLLGGRGHDGRGARARTAAEARGDEHHVRALEDLLDLLAILEGGVLAHLGIGARAQALRQPRAQLDLERGGRGAERLAVRIRHDELDAGEAGFHHAIDGVGPAAAETDDLDLGVVPRLFQLEHRSPCPWLYHRLLLGHLREYRDS